MEPFSAVVFVLALVGFIGYEIYKTQRKKKKERPVRERIEDFRQAGQLLSVQEEVLLTPAMKFVAFALLLTGVTSLSDAQVTLKGQAPDFAHKTISVFEYEDSFTGTRHEKSNSVLAADGSFAVSVPVREPVFMDIFLEGSYSGVYLQPGFEYELVFDKKGRITAVSSADPTNEIIQAFDAEDDALFEFQKKKIYSAKINEFVTRKRGELEKLPDFAKLVLSYRLSNRELTAYFGSPDTAVLNQYERRMFLARPVINKIPDYYVALKRFYFDRANTFAARRTVFNGKKPFQSMLAEMEYIPNDSVRNFAYLTVLSASYKASWGPSRDRINNLIDSVEHASANEKVKVAAMLLKRKINSLEPGQRIRDFSFEDYMGGKYNLSTLKGKYVLLDFWFIGCSECVKSFPNLRKIKDAAKGKLEIVSLTPFDSGERIESFLKKRSQFDWIFSPIDQKANILHYFNVRGYPTYFLLSPEGSLIKAFDSMATEQDLRQVIELVK